LSHFVLLSEGDMAKERRFSLGARVLGALCLALSVGTLIWGLVAGFSLVSGGLFALAASGVAVPCVLAGGSVSEIALAFIELLGESIGTLVEAVVDFISSLF
jgi:hypothetical protein